MISQNFGWSLFTMNFSSYFPLINQRTSLTYWRMFLESSLCEELINEIFMKFNPIFRRRMFGTKIHREKWSAKFGWSLFHDEFSFHFPQQFRDSYLFLQEELNWSVRWNCWLNEELVRLHYIRVTPENSLSSIPAESYPAKSSRAPCLDFPGLSYDETLGTFACMLREGDSDLQCRILEKLGKQCKFAPSLCSHTARLICRPLLNILGNPGSRDVVLTSIHFLEILFSGRQAQESWKIVMYHFTVLSEFLQNCCEIIETAEPIGNIFSLLIDDREKKIFNTETMVNIFRVRRKTKEKIDAFWYAKSIEEFSIDFAYQKASIFPSFNWLF